MKSVGRNIAAPVLAATVLALRWSTAYGDYYDRVVRFECDPGRKAVHISLLTPYEDAPLGSHDILFEDLAAKQGGLTCRLSAHTVVVARALANPQAARNDNLQVLVGNKQVAAMTFDTSSSHSLTITEPARGGVQVDQSN